MLSVSDPFDLDPSLVVFVVADHHPFVPGLGPGGLFATSVRELGVLAIVAVLEGPAIGAMMSNTPLPKVPASHN